MTDHDTERIQQATDEAADEGRERRPDPLLIGGGIVLVLAVLGLFVLVLLQGGSLHQVKGALTVVSGKQQVAATAARQLADQVKRLGGTPVVTPPAPVSSPQLPVATGPTQEAIDNAVFGYFAVHPPGATPAMVAVQVAEYLTAHPPKPGSPASPTEIATAASDYIAAHADDFRGQPGANATDAQVASAVDAFCSEHDGCAGPAGQQGDKGDQGDQGASITDLVFERDDAGACQAVATIHDPATGQDTTVAHPAGDAACPPVSAPPTSDPPSGLLNVPGGRR